MPSSRGCRSSYNCIVKIKDVTTRPILFSQLMRSDGEGAMNPEEFFAGNRTPASEQERVHEDELHSLMRKILDWAISFLSESSQGMVPAVWVCESAGAMGRGAERAPQAVRRLALRFRPSVVARRVRPRLAAVREGEGVQRRRMPVLLGAQGARRLQRPGHHDPGIAAMWHPRMNKRLEPTGVQAISRKPAWWRGECGRVYQMAVRDRVRAKPGYCPYCSGRKRPERPIRLD